MLLPKRLQQCSVIGLVSPAGAMYEAESFDLATENLEALGLVVKPGQHLRARHGYLAGTDEQRAADLHAMFADPSVDAIIAMRGGFGTARLLPLLDYDLIARNPKILIGFSDITALLLAIYHRTGLVTFHGPVASGGFNSFTFGYFAKVLFNAEMPLLENPNQLGDHLVRTADRVRTICPGKAKGVLAGGNLTVICSIIGSGYLPDWQGKILFIEDVNEDIYKIDRMMTQLSLAGVLKKLAGVAVGKFTGANPAQSYGSLTLEEVLSHHLCGLGIPVFTGAMIGHISSKFTVPIGVEAEIDADAGTLRLLQPAVL
ncbi:MAG: LD-carboxypeptidase [Bernardetiaceae bacterium]|nr:LD-carboxypeptidase [Bernardetiaceae bacterium]